MRGACKRAESECRFAHPQESVTTHEDGSVTVCMDSVKGGSPCRRDPCRYFHPPLHLQAQIKAAQSRATAVWLILNKTNPKKNIPWLTQFSFVFFFCFTFFHNSYFFVWTNFPLSNSKIISFLANWESKFFIFESSRNFFLFWQNMKL